MTQVDPYASFQQAALARLRQSGLDEQQRHYQASARTSPAVGIDAGVALGNSLQDYLARIAQGAQDTISEGVRGAAQASGPLLDTSSIGAAASSGAGPAGPAAAPGGGLEGIFALLDESKKRREGAVEEQSSALLNYLAQTVADRKGALDKNNTESAARQAQLLDQGVAATNSAIDATKSNTAGAREFAAADLRALADQGIASKGATTEASLFEGELARRAAAQENALSQLGAANEAAATRASASGESVAAAALAQLLGNDQQARQQIELERSQALGDIATQIEDQKLQLQIDEMLRLQAEARAAARGGGGRGGRGGGGGGGGDDLDYQQALLLAGGDPELAARIMATKTYAGVGGVKDLLGGGEPLDAFTTDILANPDLARSAALSFHDSGDVATNDNELVLRAIYQQALDEENARFAGYTAKSGSR